MNENRFKDPVFLRGGAWYNSSADYFRTHYRNWYDPVDKYIIRGFRCISPETSELARRLIRIR